MRKSNGEPQALSSLSSRSTFIDTEWLAFKRFRHMWVLRLGRRHGWRLNIGGHAPAEHAVQAESEGKGLLTR
jgi:hypothetical protein